MTLPPTFTGPGFFAGEAPDGLTTVAGIPTSAQVRIYWRDPDGGEDVLVASTQSASDGTWRITNLNPELSYVVRAQKTNYDDVTVVGAQPSRTDVIDVIDLLEPNEDSSGLDGHVLLNSGLTPFSVSVIEPLPFGLEPAINGRVLTIEGTSDDVGVWESVVRVTASNGVFVDVPVTVEIAGQTFYEYALSLSPLAYWPLDEATLGPVLDHSGNGLHGTLTDTPRVTLRGVPLRRGHAGAMGFCVDSLGTARVTAPSDARIQSLMDAGKSGTIAFWAKRTAWSTYNFVVALWDNPFSGSARYRVYGGGFTFETPQNANRVASVGADVLDEVFFVVARKNAGESKCDLFVNGTWYSFSKGWTDPARSGTNALQFPATGGWNYYGMRGYLSDMALFDRALTNAEVEKLYALGLE